MKPHPRSPHARRRIQGVINTEQQDSFGFGSDYKDLTPTQIPLGLVKTP